MPLLTPNQLRTRPPQSPKTGLIFRFLVLFWQSFIFVCWTPLNIEYFNWYATSNPNYELQTEKLISKWDQEFLHFQSIEDQLACCPRAEVILQVTRYYTVEYPICWAITVSISIVATKTWSIAHADVKIHCRGCRALLDQIVIQGKRHLKFDYVGFKWVLKRCKFNGNWKTRVGKKVCCQEYIVRWGGNEVITDSFLTFLK